MEHVLSQADTDQAEASNRGRPRKSGRSIKITIRLREGEHDAILERLKRLPRGRRSSYVRRILAAAVEAQDPAREQGPGDAKPSEGQDHGR